MRYGVIGLGAIAPFFLEAIERCPDSTLAAVCDLDPAKTEALAKEGTAAFTDYRQLLAADVCDAVIITLPNHVHAEAAIAALDAGVAVCCEKPLAITSVDANRMAEAAERNGKTLFTAFHRRYNRHLIALREALPEDRSQITKLTVRYHENILEHIGGDGWYLDPERCGGGCLIDNGPNALDMAHALVGGLSLVGARLGDVRSGIEYVAELDLVSHDGVPVRVELDWALTTGETKDVVAELADGSVLRADMLEGFTAFKSSLQHEYDGILADFRDQVAARRTVCGTGVEIVGLVEDAYAAGREESGRRRSKLPARTKAVRLLFHTSENRGMSLSQWGTRCIPAGQIHELVTTTDRPRAAGDRIDAVGFLGFVEFQEGTVIALGDEVRLADDRLIGTVAGFDECHFPNHYNIVIASDRLWTATSAGLEPGDDIRFVEG
ncbi:Gfo/Idh/MocA family oxidoreductase [Streptomyces sp. NPDC005890]|uniref:Gfo/Idh/MocA family protein n=1 Tax=Streptomyces sp. NPDC005890 TaxID=3154568 RepID=UPI0033D2E175